MTYIRHARAHARDVTHIYIYIWPALGRPRPGARLAIETNRARLLRSLARRGSGKSALLVASVGIIRTRGRGGQGGATAPPAPPLGTALYMYMCMHQTPGNAPGDQARFRTSQTPGTRGARLLEHAVPSHMQNMLNFHKCLHFRSAAPLLIKPACLLGPQHILFIYFRLRQQ